MKVLGEAVDDGKKMLYDNALFRSVITVDEWRPKWVGNKGLTEMEKIVEIAILGQKGGF